MMRLRRTFVEIAVFLEVFDQVGVPRQPGNTKDHATAGLSLRMFLSDLDWEVPGEKRVLKELGVPPSRAASSW